MNTTICPNCNHTVDLPGPRLIASVYMPTDTAAWTKCYWALHDDGQKYLLLADHQDMSVVDGHEVVHWWIFRRPYKEVPV